MRLKNVFLCVFLPLRPFIRPTVHLLQGYLLSFISLTLSPPKLFSTESLLATGSFICKNWINIVDGTNIVNLPKNGADWIQSLQTIPGEKHSETVPLYWKSSVLERLLALTNGDAEFALINAEVPLQSWSEVFL